jgi:signal transduction histidine kinase
MDKKRGSAKKEVEEIREGYPVKKVSAQNPNSSSEMSNSHSDVNSNLKKDNNLKRGNMKKLRSISRYIIEGPEELNHENR